MAETRVLPKTNQPRGEGPLWRLLAGLGRGLSGEWRPVHSPGIQYDAPPEPTALGEAEIVEGDAFQLHEVGDAETSGFEFSLDGIEMTRVSGYVGFIPIVHGYVAAVIRQRTQGSFTTWAVSEEEVLAFPFNELDPKQLTELGVPKSQLLDCTVDPDGLHPIRLAELGRQAIKRKRSALEAQLARRWAETETEGGWLLVDGSLAIDPKLLRSGRAVGLVKSHRTQFLDQAAMHQVLGMDAGFRSSLFRPVRPKVGEVYSWYLRLRAAAGHDIYWSLARVEGRADAETIASADTISGWLLHETAPLAMPDPRWHVLLYPIRDCEQYLRARMPTLTIS